ncbi:MAG: hypothetical protein ACFCU7_11710 [Pleurocapsa sp.]
MQTEPKFISYRRLKYNRHAKGALPGEYPVNDADIYTKVIPKEHLILRL